MTTITKVTPDQALTVGGALTVEGDVALAAGVIGTTELADDAVTADKLADAVNSSIAAKVATADLAAATSTAAGSDLVGVWLDEALTLSSLLSGLSGAISRLEGENVAVTVSIGATIGTSEANADLIGGRIIGFRPVLGNDQSIASMVINESGSVVITLAGASTTEAAFSVNCRVAGD